MVAPNRSRPSARDSAEIQRHESMNAAVAQSILVARQVQTTYYLFIYH
jgi:hypothetical protein